MNPFEILTELDVNQTITVYDEHNNKYIGEFKWDSQEEIHRIDDYKLAADYTANKVYIIKPIEDEKISGFMAQITDIQIPNK